MNLTLLTPYLPYWHYYKTNHCLPPISLGTLQSIEAIYRQELHPAPVRLYCGVCVADMFTSLFGAWEREQLEQKEKESAFAQATADEKEIMVPNQAKFPKKRNRMKKKIKPNTTLTTPNTPAGC